MLGRRRPNVQKLARRGKASRLLDALSYRDELVDREGHVFDLGVEVRRQAAAALAEVDGLHVFDALVAALDDDAPSVRAAAAQALGARGNARAVTELAWASASPGERNGEARVAARQALRQLGAPGTAELLAEALIERGGGFEEARVTMEAALAREGELAVRAVIGQALDYLSPPSGDERCARAERLVQWVGPQAVPTLISALDDAGTRAAAAAALGQLHDSRATEALLELLHEPEPEIRAAAARALGAIKDPRAVEALVAAAPDPEYQVREAAMQALEGLWSVAVMSELRERLSAEQHEELRSTADVLERAMLELSSPQDEPPAGREDAEGRRRHGVRRLFGHPPEQT
jgi:HEAT repeat protein